MSKICNSFLDTIIAKQDNTLKRQFDKYCKTESWWRARHGEVIFNFGTYSSRIRGIPKKPFQYTVHSYRSL